MKHGVAFRKFSRTSSHRMLMLRNLVTSLFEHERIKTTLPKARDTARLAEKMITLGKRGDMLAHQKASGFLLKPEVIPKLFTSFAQRYATRPGGYTRIHKYGNRPGDNAPVALLELVDAPHDVRFAMTARTVGRETLALKLQDAPLRTVLSEGLPEMAQVVERERALPIDAHGLLNLKTRMNLQKVLQFRGQDAAEELVKEAQAHTSRLLERPIRAMQLFSKKQTLASPDVPTKRRTRLDTPGGVPHEVFRESRATATRGALPVSHVRERGNDVIRRLQGPFIKPKRIPRWMKPGFGAKPKLGVALSLP